MSDAKDWRLTNQERYLKKAVLVWRQYAPEDPANDHDHCEFCGAKFSLSAGTDAMSEGYSTPDRYRWICKPCFEDFATLFAWRVEHDASHLPSADTSGSKHSCVEQTEQDGTGMPGAKG